MNSSNSNFDRMSNFELAQTYIINKFTDRERIINALETEDFGDDDFEDDSNFDQNSDTQSTSSDDNQGRRRGYRTRSNRSRSSYSSGTTNSNLDTSGNTTGNQSNSNSGSKASGNNGEFGNTPVPPSLGKNTKGHVTDPSTDGRLRQNETPELHQSRVEAGQKGGSSTGGTVAEESQLKPEDTLAEMQKLLASKQESGAPASEIKKIQDTIHGLEKTIHH